VLQQMSQRLDWMAFREKDWVKQQRNWMPGRLQHQGLYNNERGPDVDAAWQRAKELALEVVRKVQKSTRLVGVMAGNWHYWSDEGLRLACEELGVPFLVLMPEHNLTEAKPEREHYENSKLVPKTASVAVASDLTADFLSAIGVLLRAKLRSTGLPRFDARRMPLAPLYDRPRMCARSSTSIPWRSMRLCSRAPISCCRNGPRPGSPQACRRHAPPIRW
jgi:hypothetical protein